MKKTVNKENIGISSSKVTLNLKGKKVTLSIDEIRELSNKLNSFLNPNSYNTYLRQYFPFGNTVTTLTNPIYGATAATTTDGGGFATATTNGEISITGAANENE